ncbi:hypothetical protein O6H91_13G046900 [Diphasiastrum complanatum]|nr:hypothetical protein O6H91_13G009000 [Diphasiastrum complanatum]KAJ7532552.1 hypothetical protein O6H91_13G009000 [Diphasiastrum complanatum]KAJ7532553.1 hypothetical protein O6H91_13G009000 [Diphasiastrum complanatum]KAJ7533399.1 hypothetical protein O6H91_13G046900 [Diphasiastrum complanatum]KAJ7533401.1 hypothetical protein O6H91_13G046900 [Diphasiastrum complanatum]
MDSLQKLCSTLEPLLRKVVGEEVERALSKLAPARIGPRSSPKGLQGANDKSLRLRFRNKLALPLFTGSKVEGEQGSAIHVVLQDACTGQVVTAGPEASAKLEVVVLEGDFSVDEDDDWSQEDFYSQELRERDGKRPLLTGDLTVVLKEGIGTVGELTFTDNSSWLRSRKFRLGVKIASGYCEGHRIREAKTEAFTVKDHRGELYKKHYPPTLHDEVWRLDKIGKDGAFHKRLNKAGIYTVEDFLRLVVMDLEKLRNVLGSGMSNKMWEGTVEHAKTCLLSGKIHVYYADEKHSIGVVFNNIFQLMGLIAAGQYMSVDSLSDSEKMYVDRLVKVAYENWERVVEYDGEALIDMKPWKLMDISAESADPINTRSSSSQSEHTTSMQDQAVVSSGLPVVVYQSLNTSSKDMVQEQSFSADSHNSFTTNHLYGCSHIDSGMDMSMSLLSRSSLGSTKQESVMMQNSSAVNLLPASSLQALTSPVLPYHLESSAMQSGSDMCNMWPRFQSRELGERDGFSKGGLLEEHYSEEELRMKSLELLGHEDFSLEMQQLACSNYSLQGDFNFPSPECSPAPEADGVHLQTGRTAHAKANIGWLKLKAALRWGIFIRKRAATRRAYLGLLEH